MTSTGIIGRTLAGRFRVTGFIGDGAMATVYRGVQDTEPKDVAIKIMQPQLVSDRTFVGRFRREAKAAARLRHENTVKIVHYGMEDGLLFMVMELVAGRDLFEILTIERRLSQARAASVLVQVCDALTAAHEQGIVHRDLKPENIMLVSDPADPSREHVKVLDFGIAKILEPDAADPDAPPNSLGSSVLTRIGVIVGTPAYMSPEQCRGEAIDARSDLYGCGALLFHLVTGRLPFLGESPFDFALQHVQAPPPSPSSLVPGIHPGLEAAILTALSKSPAHRQQSARQLAAELTQLIPQLSAAPGPAPPATAGAMPHADAPPAAPAPAPPGPHVATPWPSLPPPSVAPASSFVPVVAAPVAPARPAAALPWALVPVAVALGVGIGALVYALTR